MNELQQIRQPTGASFPTGGKSRTETSEDSEHKKLTRTIFKALAGDHGNRFLSQFDKSFGKSAYTPDTWRWRLYARILEFSPMEIVEGFEMLSGSEYVPNIEDIVQSIKKRKKAALESAAVAEMPVEVPEPKADPERIVKCFTDAKNSVSGAGEDDRPDRLGKKLSAHKKLLAEHIARGLIRQPMFDYQHACCVKSCTKPGTVSGSVTGTENWLCMTHFRAKN